MDPRREQLLLSLNYHRVALGGTVVAILLGAMTGGALRPAGLLEEPMAAQLIASQAQAAYAPPLVVEDFPTDAANRPWVAGTDDAQYADLPRVRAAYVYEEPAYPPAVEPPMAMPSSTPSVLDHASDAVAQEDFSDEPAA